MDRFLIDSIIGAVILIAILIFFIYITYQRYVTPQVAEIYLQCLPNQCATNIYNGLKRCPLESDVLIAYDPSYEVCNYKFTCENSITPYAQHPNGSTTDNGICSDGTCKCLRSPQCPYSNIVLFSLQNGSIQINGASSKALFYQIPLSNQGESGNQNLSYNFNTSTYCSIKASHLNRLSSGSCYFNDPNNISLAEITECLYSNPCQIGSMAFNPKNPETFELNSGNLNAIYSVPVGCFPSEMIYSGCPPSTIPVWNQDKATIICQFTE